MRIAIVLSHPIQHFCPQYVSFTQIKGVVTKVFFASKLGSSRYVDKNFMSEISWGNLHLEKFDHIFLNGDAVLQSTASLDAPSLETELNKFGPDLLFVYGYFQKFQRRAYNWGFKNNIKIAYIADSEMHHKEPLYKRLLKYFYLRRYFRVPDVFLTLGNANEAYYLHHNVSKEKLLRMHHPIDRNLYLSSFNIKNQLRTDLRTKLHIGENEIVLAVVGKLVPWKNQDHIIHAMRKLEEKGLYLHLLLIGSGSMQEKWSNTAKELHKSVVHFTGFIPIEELPAYYAASDIYVHPAALEPHSVAISEAIAMGLPVILSDRCGSYGDTDDVQVGKNGAVYPFGNIDVLAHHIETFANDKDLRDSFGHYSQQLSIGFQQRSHHTVLEELFTRFGK